MENKIPTTYMGGVTKGEELANGADQYADTIPLLQNTPVDIRVDVTGSVEAGAEVVTSKTELRTRQRAVRTALVAARGFLTLTRDISKPGLGSEANEQWINLGLSGSLIIPRAEREVVGVLRSFQSFLANNASFEVAGKDITAVKAKALLDQVVNARTAVGLQQKHLADMVADRKAKAVALRKRIRNTIAELSMRLTPLDSRWLAFKLNKPGAEATPDVPSNLTVVLVGPTAAAVNWDPSARAQYYRVWMRIGGETQPWTHLGSPADLDFTIEVLLRNTKTEVAVSAVNSGGESAKSAITAVTTPA